MAFDTKSVSIGPSPFTASFGPAVEVPGLLATVSPDICGGIACGEGAPGGISASLIAEPPFSLLEMPFAFSDTSNVESVLSGLVSRVSISSGSTAALVGSAASDAASSCSSSSIDGRLRSSDSRAAASVSAY